MKLDHDTTGVKENEGFPLMSEGPYRLKVKDIKEKVAKSSGKPMASVCLEVVDHPEYTGRLVWHNVTFVGPKEPGAGMTKHFLKAVGVDFEGKIEVDTDNWIGQEIAVTLKVGEPYKGKSNNEIDVIHTDDNPESEEEQL